MVTASPTWARDGAEFAITGTGNGLAAGDLERVFERVLGSEAFPYI
jgi:hypothetical protein